MRARALRVDSALIRRPSKLQFNICVGSPLATRVRVGASEKGHRGAFILCECQQHSVRHRIPHFAHFFHSFIF